ncbi:membrane protein [Clostridium botulinum]|uniref:Membrane protein n=1 Tax=Clostridium botulinum TaxID=1491 RepID=A0A9Q1UYN1_CLOBO|nr:membrane protein [Clostridium botulinum]KEH96030.1 putative membrane protein [Clostridium botulinum C/D str. Sp77]KEH96981.1 membrane protein [Clostridium botulinum D str. 16868]KOA74091.1 membrane protein [Clostridium botulinum]KOA74134.1 membrane protein [Clostridium botulinum]KOA83860.1 membrane protein [Clostridium botulinum]
MRKIKAILKYEFLNLNRNFIIIIMLLLFIFGLQQQLWTSRISGEFRLNLVTFLKTFWLPINLIYMPILIINEIIGSSNQEIFEVLNIPKGERFLAKILTSTIINLIIIMINVLIVVAVAIIAKGPFKYSLYLILMYLLNIITALFCYSSIGLLIGETISKFRLRIFSYLLMILFFLITNNFYREPTMVTPIMKIDPLPSTFELFSLDKLTFYHFAFWNLITLLILYLLYNIKELQSLMLRNKIILCFLVVAIFTSYFIGSKYNPERYYIENDNINKNYEKESSLSDGFTIENYNMKLKLQDIVSNDCDMTIVVNNSELDKLDLNLYHILKPSSIKINEKETKFKFKDDKLTILLQEKYNEGEKIKVSIKYSGVINTIDQQGKKRFFVNSHSIFLSDYFPWYPKPEFMGNTKKYQIKIQNNNGQIYSSLNEKSNGTFEGKGKEIFLVKNKLFSKHLYKGIEFVGNTEQIGTDALCEHLMYSFENMSNLHNYKRLIATPQRDKEYLIYNLYEGQVMFGLIDYKEVL